MGDAPFPDPAAIARAELLTREQFVFTGETLEEALAPGTPRRRAFDAALAEVGAGHKVPSLEWRREFSLMLGLERLLSDDEPRLADGTVLNAHQVDALSGTLTALLAAQLVSGGGVAVPVAAEAIVDLPETEIVASAVDAGPPGPAQEQPSGDGPDARDAGEARDAGDSEDEDSEDDDDEDEDDEPLDIDMPDTGIDDDDEDEPEDEGSDDDEPVDWQDDAVDEDVVHGDADDPGADRRFWFEHATGAGKTVAAMGFVEASRTGGVLILTHRRNLVDQFIGEIKTRGYRDRLCAPLLIGEDAANGPVTVETYQWFVRNAGKISDAYTVVICDEAHTALGEKTSAQIRSWDKPIWIGMTATGALIARHVTDLFPTQTSRFDLAQAARRGVIAPLRCIRIPPGPGVRTIAKVPLRRGEVDTEFDQEMLAELLDQTPFNLAIADLYKTRFNGVPGVVYTAGVKHAYNVAESFRALGMKAQAVSGETPKRELARILADYESGKVDVLINAQLLAEGWNSPRATICMHLAPTASKRIYQQRVGRVTRRHPGKESGIVVDFVHPATKHDDPVVTLHSLLDRDVYRGGAIVVGPVRRGRGRRVRVERRVLPVTPDPERRAEVFERELWRIAVENLDYGEQHVWAALAGARVSPTGWRRAKAMLHFDRQGELKRRFLVTALQRNKHPQLRLRALQEIAALRDAEAFDTAIDLMASWPRDDRREGVKIMLLALAERRIGRRDQANAWIWRLAEYTRDVHEEYAVQRWPETKRLLGLLVNSSGSAHARNARRIVHATRKEDRRLSAALLAAAVAHSPEAEEALRGARTRMARKPAALARELLRNFPKGKRSGGGGSASKRRRGRKGGASSGAQTPVVAAVAAAVVGEEAVVDGAVADGAVADGAGAGSGRTEEVVAAVEADVAERVEEERVVDAPEPVALPAARKRAPSRRRGSSRGVGGAKPDAIQEAADAVRAATEAGEAAAALASEQTEHTGAAPAEPKPKPKRARAPRKKPAEVAEPGAGADSGAEASLGAGADSGAEANTAAAADARARAGDSTTGADAPDSAPVAAKKPAPRRAPRQRATAQSPSPVETPDRDAA